MHLTFGQAFGRLIRAKRAQEGWTQRQLAIQAFDDEGKTRRIVDIEKGSVRRPHASTVDALVVALAITKDELDKCETGATPAQEDEDAIGLSRQLMENLALRFEHDNPDASDKALFEFLKQKAAELKALRLRLQTLDSQSAKIRDKITAANAALDGGEFAEADQLLAEAEDIQYEQRTLKEIQAQSTIRTARAEAALLDGQPDTAASHYKKAADYFRPFDLSKTGDILDEASGAFYETERRTNKPDFRHALELISLAIEATQSEIEITKNILRRYRLAILQQEQGRAKKSAEFLDAAVKTSQTVLAEAEGKTDNTDYANIVILAGNCLLARGQLNPKSGSTDLRAALRTFEGASSDPRIPAEQHSYIQTSIHVTSDLISQLEGEERNGPFHRRATTALSRAIELSAEHHQLDVWAASQCNLGMELARHAAEIGDTNSPIAHSLRIQSIAALNASIEGCATNFLSPIALRAQLALGRVLLDQARSVNPTLADSYFARSIHANSAAAAFLENSDPNWSNAHFTIGTALLLHSELAPSDVAVDDLQNSLKYYEAARSGYEHLEMFDELRKVEGAIHSANRRLQELRNP